jgi:NADH-quinone oxidoreductase subunit G
MEYYLINHPLDCPICDKAGECYLQDYTEQYGPATSPHGRGEAQESEEGHRFADAAVLRTAVCSATRCVRFTDEIAGTGELRIVSNRGSRGEIDVFPGEPLENPLQGNVVDLCPVGALLDKDFLFKQRVWLLKSARRRSAGRQPGARPIWIDWNEEGRSTASARASTKRSTSGGSATRPASSWKYIHSDERLTAPMFRDDGQLKHVRWEELGKLLTAGFAEASEGNDGASVAVVLSPMMACEEAWLLAGFIRSIAPQATLCVGYVPTQGEDQSFPAGRAAASPAARFTIRAEKCPNRRGIETLLEQMGGPTATFGDFLAQAGRGKFVGIYLYGGYPTAWLTPDIIAAFERVEFLVRHDLFPASIDETKTTLRIPAAVWAEREGTFMNIDGLLQPFERAIPPREGVKFDGQFFAELAQQPGLFRAAKIREQMAGSMPVFGEIFEPQPEPKFAH